MTTNGAMAARLRDRIAAGDTLAIIEAVELMDALIDAAMVAHGGDSVDFDCGPVLDHAGLDDIAVTIDWLSGHGETCVADAIRLGSLYRANGGREVCWTSEGVLVRPAGRMVAV